MLVGIGGYWFSVLILSVACLFIGSEAWKERNSESNYDHDFVKISVFVCICTVVSIVWLTIDQFAK